MASKRLSPAANLLRHSRLFSLPPPLPAARAEIPGSNTERYSDTATQSYPTQPAIETTIQALRHNDWGMKRPLPPKAAQTSTPVIRVHQVDSIDHITEYDSAADHVLTAQKWREMDIPIMLDQQNKPHAYISDSTPPRTAFEEIEQKQDPAGTSAAAGGISNPTASKKQSRWRFDGPWLLGMTEMEFEEYVSKGLRRRRSEFAAMLRTHLAQDKANKAKARALERGEQQQATGETSSAATPTLSDEEFRAGVKRLRVERHELWGLVWKFLDIPGNPPPAPSSSASSSSSLGFLDAVDHYLGDSAEGGGGPPATHPSAGLAYARTPNHVYNHPRLGPVHDRPPVRARVLQHGGLVSSSKSGQDMLGVGGVVAARRSENRPLDAAGLRHSSNRFDDQLVGGAKAWVQPRHASIGRDGRIKLEVRRATEDASAIWDHYVTPGTHFNDADIAGSMAWAGQSDRKAKADAVAAKTAR